MKRRSLRRLSLTELGLGGAPLANLYQAVSDEEAFGTIDAAWNSGIRYFDTAPHYGLGLSEQRLGRALRARPREDFVLSTKVGRLLEPNPTPTGSDLAAGGFDVRDTLVRRFDFSRDGVRRSLDASLQRLGLDRVDIVYVHDPDEHVEQALTEALPTLVELREQGVIGAVGVGMNQWQAPLRMVRESDLDVVMLAGRWTLLDRSGEPLLAECAERDVGVVVAAPFNSGLLAFERPPADARFDYASADPQTLSRANALADVCEANGISLPVAAVQFPLRSNVVRSVVCGLRSVAEVEQAVDRLAAEVPREAWPHLVG